MPQQLSSSLESSLRTEHLEGFILSHLRPPFFTLLEGQKKLKRQRIKEEDIRYTEEQRGQKRRPGNFQSRRIQCITTPKQCWTQEWEW